MNGPRTLSNENMSYLVISMGESLKENQGSEVADYDLFMCAPHFTGDGTSLHQATHDFLTLLASVKEDAQLLQELEFPLNWVSNCFACPCWLYISLTCAIQADKLPPAFETRCPQPRNIFARAVSQVNFLKTLEKEIVRSIFTFLFLPSY